MSVDTISVLRNPDYDYHDKNNHLLDAEQRLRMVDVKRVILYP